MGKPAVATAPSPTRVPHGLASAVTTIERSMGRGAVMWLDESPRGPINVIPTSSLALNVALRVGGVPRGRFTEIYGPESSGKTTIALDLIAHAQAAGGCAAFIDAEHALDLDYAEALGVDLSKPHLLFSQPDTGEQALEIADRLIDSGDLSIVVIDSVAALVPRAELEGEMGDSHVGLHPRLMSQALRKLAGKVGNTGTAVVFINQMREKVGVLFGSPEKTTGGRALAFYSSVRLDVRRTETLKDGNNEPCGSRTRIKVVKNKVGRPYGVAECDILYGLGISREAELIDMGVELGVIRKAGAYYVFDGNQIGQGRELTRKALKSKRTLANAVEKQIKAKLKVRESQRAISA